MANILGIIGGGQLGMMLTEAAKKLPKYISEVIVLDPTKGCPATKVGAKQIIADFKDENAIVRLSKKCDIITYEIELGNSSILKKIERQTTINPSPDTLKVIQDKLLQKTFLKENNLPVADFTKINSFTDLQNKLEDFGYPAILKARKDSYDGRGNFKIKSKDEVRKAYTQFSKRDLFLEKFIGFKKEVSVIAARSTSGEVATYSLVENIHEENILKMTIAPARVSKKVSEKAEKIAQDTMDVLKGAGVFGIEMFLTKNNGVLINEIAPRVHNSGHHTLQSSKTSQFEQHLRAILGLKLGDTRLLHPTIMYNILGPKGFQGRYRLVTPKLQKGVYLKMYEKKESKPKRKLGHVNVIAQKKEKVSDLLRKVEQLKKTFLIKPIA